MRDVLARLIAAGHWRPGDPRLWVVIDAARLAWLLRDLLVRVLARLRPDRVLRRPAPPKQVGVLSRPRGHGDEFMFGDPARLGRPRGHGDEFMFGDPASRDDPDVTTVTETRLNGTATARGLASAAPTSDPPCRLG